MLCLYRKENTSKRAGSGVPQASSYWVSLFGSLLKVNAICVFYIVLSSSPLGATGFFSESLREKKALMRTLHLCGASLLLAPLRMLLNQHLTLHPSLPTTTWLVLGVKRVALPTVCRISVGATDTGYVPVLSRLCGLQLLLLDFRDVRMEKTDCSGVSKLEKNNVHHMLNSCSTLMTFCLTRLG